jgi:alanine racemase
VGYNRAWVAERDTQLAILSVGYADGLNRHLGGKGHVMIGGRKAPIVGKVCMDMCFVDVTDVPCCEGDRAVFFGEGDLLESNAAAAGTITYELLTNVSPRVRRIYIQE